MRRDARPTVLQWTLAVSVAVHGVLLTAHAVDPIAFERVFRDPPLEVILVNAGSPEPPPQARAIAQKNLAGGGELAKGRATSPLPAADVMQLGDAAQTTHRRADDAQLEPQQLLAAVRAELASLPLPDPLHDSGTPQERELEERTRQLVRQLAEIEKRISEESEKPRKRYISPATRAADYAVYYDQLRRRIEDRGTRDFPQAGGRKLYGDLTMDITIDAAGRLVQTEIVRRSTTPALDRQAVAIVEASAPFGALPESIRQQNPRIIVTSRFRFARDDGLETTLTTRTP